MFFFLKQVRISPEKDWCSHQYPYGGILPQVAAVFVNFYVSTDMIAWWVSVHWLLTGQTISIEALWGPNWSFSGCVVQSGASLGISGPLLQIKLQVIINMNFSISELHFVLQISQPS